MSPMSHLCKSIDTLSMAYLDDELAAGERQELEHHLLECEGCRGHVDDERADLELIRRRLVSPPAPDLLRAKLGRALDGEDRQAGAARRRGLARYLLPGSAIAAAAAALLVVFAGHPPADGAGAVAQEAVRQQLRQQPLEVQGASTGPWLRQHLAPSVEPVRFTDSRIELIGGRLTAVGGHDGAQLFYAVRNNAGERINLTAFVLQGLADGELSGGQELVLRDGRVLHVVEANGVPAVTFVADNREGYVFTSDRLTWQELVDVVVSSELIGRASADR
jgi:anti-sigma factor RsiW